MPPITILHGGVQLTSLSIELNAKHLDLDEGGSGFVSFCGYYRDLVTGVIEVCLDALHVAFEGCQGYCHPPIMGATSPSICGGIRVPISIPHDGGSDGRCRLVAFE